MATRITFELPDRFDDELAGITNRDVQMILMDALYEFKAHRHDGNGTSYVDKRYPLRVYDEGKRAWVDNANCAYPEGPARERKIQQVEQRCQWAEALHAGQVKHIEHVVEEGE